MALTVLSCQPELVVSALTLKEVTRRSACRERQAGENKRCQGPVLAVKLRVEIGIHHFLFLFTVSFSGFVISHDFTDFDHYSLGQMSV